LTLWHLLEAAFWFCAIGSGFSYFFYPAILLLAPRVPVNLAAPQQLPRISVIIAARNEQKRIEHKLRSTLALDYPRELLEIIVASDASDDRTDEIVRFFGASGVRLSRHGQRGGKEAAQAHAIGESTGEVIVFTDSATRLEPDALQRIARNFSDPTVGAVSSEDRLEPVSTRGSSSGEAAYVRYEMWLRRLESDRAGLVGLSGSLFAVRRLVAERWPIHVPSDISAALRAASLGLRVIADPDLCGYYSDLHDTSNEYERKVRTVVRGMAAVANMRELLNPFRYGWYSFQLWGHKILRWMTPVFLIVLWAVSGLLAAHGTFYLAMFALQSFVYGVAALAWLIPQLQRIAPLRLACYLVQVHVALLDAGLRYARGERIIVWSPSVR
jgi:cellulose synthase/poly-beta-1,6-N-acetylglucosamine synthase-like glycosyltransferase